MNERNFSHLCIPLDLRFIVSFFSSEDFPFPKYRGHPMSGQPSFLLPASTNGLAVRKQVTHDHQFLHFCKQDHNTQEVPHFVTFVSQISEQ